jgi:hypothetical protein
MYVRWQWWYQRRRGSELFHRDTPATGHAILVEAVRIDGKPKQRHIAYLGSVHGEQDVYYRAWWWHRMSAKLDALGNRIPPQDRPRIVAALARLMCYGPNIPAVFRRLAELVDRILKGARPAEIPIEQVSRLDFVINLRTAHTLGIPISPALLARADEVIE